MSPHCLDPSSRFARSLRVPIITSGALALAVGIGACGSSDKKSSTSTAPAAAKPAAPAQPTTLSITTSDAPGKRFSMQAPTSVKGGLVQISFMNASKVSHGAGLLRMEGTHTIKEVLKFVATDGPTKVPDWAHAEGGVIATPPGKQAVVTENLPAGHYMVLDTETGGNDKAPPPMTRGATAEFDVTPRSDGPLPETDSAITVVDKGKDKYAFQTTGLKAGANKLLFANKSKSDNSLHHVVMFPIRPGVSFAKVKKAFMQEGKPSGPPPVDFAHATGTEVLDAQRKLVTTLTLRKGRYALVCFLNDRDELKPHFKEGLLKEVTVR